MPHGTSRWTGIAFLLVAALAGTRPGAVAAQSWALVDGIGYAGAGAALGAAGALIAAEDIFSVDDGTMLGAIGLGTALGAVVGAVAGHRAEGALARGDTLSPGHRNFVLIGAVLAGTTVGMSAGIALTEGAGAGDSVGQGLALSGTALGALYALWRRDTLEPRTVDVAPAVSSTGAGVELRIRF